MRALSSVLLLLHLHICHCVRFFSATVASQRYFPVRPIQYLHWRRSYRALDAGRQLPGSLSLPFPLHIASDVKRPVCVFEVGWSALLKLERLVLESPPAARNAAQIAAPQTTHTCDPSLRKLWLLVHTPCF